MLLAGAEQMKNQPGKVGGTFPGGKCEERSIFFSLKNSFETP